MLFDQKTSTFLDKLHKQKLSICITYTHLQYFFPVLIHLYFPKRSSIVNPSFRCSFCPQSRAMGKPYLPAFLNLYFQLIPKHFSYYSRKATPIFLAVSIIIIFHDMDKRLIPVRFIGTQCCRI